VKHQRNLRLAAEDHSHNYDDFEFPDPSEGFFLRDDGEWVPVGGQLPEAGIDYRQLEMTEYNVNFKEPDAIREEAAGLRGQIVWVLLHEFPSTTSFPEEMWNAAVANDGFWETRSTGITVGPSYWAGRYTYDQMRMNTKRFDQSVTFTGFYGTGRTAVGPESAYLSARTVDLDSQGSHWRVGMWCNPTTIYAQVLGPGGILDTVELCPWTENVVYRLHIRAIDNEVEVIVRDGTSTDLSHTFDLADYSAPGFISPINMEVYPEALVADYNRGRYGKLYHTDWRVRVPTVGFSI